MKSLFHKLGIAIAWRVALPVAWLWVAFHQQRILKHGRPLSDEERRLVEALEIQHPDAIRICSVDRVPTPGGALLSGLGRLAGLSSHGARGMALGHGVYLEDAQAGRTSLLAHELVHVLQYERLGGTWPFLRSYLSQCLSEGYWSAPLEIEARQRAAEIAG